MSDTRLDAIPTQWSLIRRAHTQGSPTTAEEARRILVLRYAPALRRYLGRITTDQHAADDLAQDALVRLLRGDFAGADPNRGRFRDLLKESIRNLARNQWSKEARRRPKDFDLNLLADDDGATDAGWLVEWRKIVLDFAWAELKQAEQSQGGYPYTILRLRTEHPEEKSAQLAQRLSSLLGSPVRADAARQMLSRARKRFADAVIENVRSCLDDPSFERVQEELAALELLDLFKTHLADNS